MRGDLWALERVEYKLMDVDAWICLRVDWTHDDLACWIRG